MPEKNVAEPKILTRETGASIAYHMLPGKSPGIIFMTGFMSDMNGTKALALENLCRDRGHAFLRLIIRDMAPRRVTSPMARSVFGPRMLWQPSMP